MRTSRLVRLLALLVPFALSVPAYATHLPAPAFAVYAAPSTLPGATSAASPDVGVNWITGDALLNAGSAVYRFTPDFASTPPTATWAYTWPGASVTTFAQRMHTDATTGRTWLAQDGGACRLLTMTNNDGGSWSPAGAACVGADGFSLASGPHPAGASGAYARSLYACGVAAATQCARGADGGLTFGPATPVSCGYVNPGVPGDAHVGPDATLYVPFRDCGAVAGVAVSQNGGITFVGRMVPGATPPAKGFGPDVATSTSGRLWLAYPTAGHGVGVARSDDRGATWTNHGDVAYAAGVRSATFHEMVAGDHDRAAVVYLGATTDGDPFTPSFGGVWKLYVSWTDDGGATWGTAPVSSDVVQRGWLCADGAACASSRNLGERISAEIDAQGRIVIAFVDGCVTTCATGTGASNASQAALAYQWGGVDMLAP